MTNFIGLRLKFQMPSPIMSFNKFSKLCLFSLAIILLVLFLILPYGGATATASTNVGAILDVNSRIGKEAKTAMEIAVRNFNTDSTAHKLSLVFKDSQGGSIQSAYAAEELVKENKVKVILSVEGWEETALVADIGSRTQVPVLSFSAPSVTPPMVQSRWPFLITMANNDSEQVRCIAAIIRAYNWRRVITVAEDYGHGSDSGKLALFSQALHEVGSEIEYQLVLPPLSLLSNAKEVVREEFERVRDLKVQSRVFIVLRSSLPMMIHMFREAKQMGFVGEDTVWILTEAVSSFLDSFNSSVISSMEGALAIKTYHSYSTNSYLRFRAEFRRAFGYEYPEEESYEPGFCALKAYDSIKTIIKALGSTPGEASSPKVFLNNILASNFTGLSGQIQFKEGALSLKPVLRVVNIVGKKYKELDFWLPEFGFSSSLDVLKAKDSNGTDALGLKGPVNWPGDLRRVPKGWMMPSYAKPMIIGVPGRTSFEKFVKVVNATEGKYDGFCIELFHKITAVLRYDLPYKFVPHDNTYDDLVNHVYTKNYDAIVGDVTILADRMEKVEFTQPYAESGLSMIVPAESEESAWMFVKPFTWEMWLVTGAILIYTVFIVWFLEHQKNPEFQGPWKRQIFTALWFTFSSLFFAHREKINSTLTRVVVIVWLFVVLILNSIYTASLTSMLTVKQLQPNLTDIDWLLRNNLKVGCDGDSFVRNYLQNVLKFEAKNIITVSSEYKYEGEFKTNNISASFLELPYEKVFINHYCKKYVATSPTYRFGGLGFVFQKGSPIAIDFSRAILQLSENGELKKLEEKWFVPSSECTSTETDSKMESLSLHSFWGLFLITGATSTICFLIFLVHLLTKYQNDEEEDRDNGTTSNKSVWNKTASLACYLYGGQSVVTGKAPTFRPSPDTDEWQSPRWDTSPLDTPAYLQAAPSTFRQSPDIDEWLSPRWDASPPDTPIHLGAASPAEIEVVHIQVHSITNV